MYHIHNHETVENCTRSQQKINGIMQKSSPNLILNSNYHSHEHCGVKNDVLIQQRNTCLAIYELISTEKAYLTSLEEIKEGYIDCLSNKKDFQTTSLLRVFTAWIDLTSFHEIILSKLNQDKNDIGKLSRIFIDHQEDFQRYYLDICLHYSNALDDLTRIRSLKTLEMMSSCQHYLGHALPLTSYLLKPIQRILKYQMLLKVIEKSFSMGLQILARECPNQLDEMKQHQMNLRKALEAMISVADFINEKKRMFELMEHLKSLDLDVNSWGDLLKMNTFRMPRKRDRRLVLLFSNTLVICKGTFDSTLNNGDLSQIGNQPNSTALPVIEIRHVIRFKDMMLVEFIPKNPFTFHLIENANSKEQISLISDNQDIKNTWCLKIKQLILDHYDVKIPEHARQLVLNMSFDDTNHGVCSTKRSSSYKGTAKRKHSLNSGRLAKINPILNQTLQQQSPTMANVISEPLDVNGNPVHHFNGCLKPTIRSRNYSNESIIQGPIRIFKNTTQPLPKKEPSVEDLSDIDFRCIAIEINEERERKSMEDPSPQVRFRDNAETENLINKRQHRLSISNRLMSALFNDSIPNNNSNNSNTNNNNNNAYSLIDFQDSQASNCSSFLSNNENLSFLSSISNRTSTHSSVGQSNMTSCQYYEKIQQEFINDCNQYLEISHTKPVHLLTEDEINEILKPIVPNSRDMGRSLITSRQEEQDFLRVTDKVFSTTYAQEEPQGLDDKRPRTNLRVNLQRSLSQVDRKHHHKNDVNLMNSTPKSNNENVSTWQKPSIMHAFSQISLNSVVKNKKPSESSSKGGNLGNLIETIPFVDDSGEISISSSNEYSEDSAYFTKRTSSLPYSISNQELNTIGTAKGQGSDENYEIVNNTTTHHTNLTRNHSKFKLFFDKIAPNSLTKIL